MFASGNDNSRRLVKGDHQFTSVLGKDFIHRLSDKLVRQFGCNVNQRVIIGNHWCLSVIHNP
jgi:hypothetical protein